MSKRNPVGILRTVGAVFVLLLFGVPLVLAILSKADDPPPVIARLADGTCPEGYAQGTSGFVPGDGETNWTRQQDACLIR